MGDSASTVITKFFHAYFLAAALLFSQQTASQAIEPPKIDWCFDVSRDSNDNPSSSVRLMVNGHSILIASKVMATFHTLDRKDYSAHGVPKSALSACSGWWAGAGEQYYVVLERGRLALYHRGLDETVAIPKFKRIRYISVPTRK